MTNLLINNNYSSNDITQYSYDKKINLKKNLDNDLEKELEKDLDKELEKELELIIANKPIIDIILSKEQENIIDSKSNIIVDAVAGSGKTTTILHMGLKNPEKNIFQITYNNMLKREVRKKVNRLCITNMNIHTYHSLAVGYYDKNSFTDEEIKKILIENKPLKDNDIRPIDILFIDESQDMILDYYNLIKKFISDTKSNPQIIVLGDRYQGIYDFKGADVKFLTLADKIWNKPFIKLSLTQSYRLTNQIGWFVNNVMLGYNRIYTNKSGPPIDYYIANSFEVYKKIGKYIRNIIAFENILPSDIFVLVPSLKTDESPYKKLENYLVKYGIKCTTPSSDDAKLDEKVISNKIVFTTYHQAKGRERKVVILYNFDDSFLDFYSKDVTTNPNPNVITCPNILYVGVTRAIHKLILIQDSRYKPLRFLNLNKLKSNTYVNIITLDKRGVVGTDLSKNQDIKKISVTDLVKFISSSTIENLIKLVETNLFEEISKPLKQIEIPNKIKIESGNTVLWEDVSDLNGLVIPAIYESELKNTNSTIENYVFEKIQDVEIYNNLKKYSGKINIPAKNINDFLKIGNIYLSIQNKLHAKLAQIKKYNWLTKQMINDCHKLMKMIGESTKFEIPISNCDTDYINISHTVFGTIYLKGRLDAVTDSDVWEFKCVDCLTIEHKLQLIIYYWMWNKSNYDDLYGKKNFCLLNIKSGQILKLNYSGNTFIIEQIVEMLFNEKYIKKKFIDDNEFIKLCTNNSNI